MLRSRVHFALSAPCKAKTRASLRAAAAAKRDGSGICVHRTLSGRRRTYSAFPAKTLTSTGRMSTAILIKSTLYSTSRGRVAPRRKLAFANSKGLTRTLYGFMTGATFRYSGPKIKVEKANRVLGKRAPAHNAMIHGSPESPRDPIRGEYRYCISEAVWRMAFASGTLYGFRRGFWPEIWKKPAASGTICSSP